MNTEGILQSCVDDVLAGRKSPAECAALFPHIPDLELRLKAAVVLRRSRAATLRPEADQRIEAKLRQRVGVRRSPWQPAARGQWSSAALRWATAAALVVVLLLAGVGIAAASNDSLPGDPLYSVKRAGEAVQLFMTPPSARASAYAMLAQRRLGEITAISKRSNVDPDGFTYLLSDLTSETEAALTSVEDTAPEQQAEILSTLVTMAEQQQAVLAMVQASAPPQAQTGLERALEASGQARQRALERLEQVTSHKGGTSSSTPGGGGPTASATLRVFGQTQIPPGQVKKTETVSASTLTPYAPPEQTKVAPGYTQIPPHPTPIPPGETRISPSQTRVPSDAHGPP
jgi:uncharacterized protein DUF5667